MKIHENPFSRLVVIRFFRNCCSQKVSKISETFSELGTQPFEGKTRFFSYFSESPVKLIFGTL